MEQLTILDYARNADPMTQAVVTVFAETSPILQKLPFLIAPGGAYKIDRETSLPEAEFRAINGSYSSTVKGKDQFEIESTYLLGGDLGIDPALEARYAGQPDALAREVQKKIKAINDTFTRKFIKGDNDSNKLEFSGLQKKAPLVISAGSTSGGDALSLALLDEAIAECRGCNALLMSRKMSLLLTSATRSVSISGTITYDINQFGQRVAMYNGVPIIEVVGANGDDDILTFSEAGAGGGSSVCTSIYAAKLAPDGVAGLQTQPIQIRQLAETTGTVLRGQRMDWDVGLGVIGHRSLIRLKGIKNAAIVA